MTPEPITQQQPPAEETKNQWAEYEKRKAELPSDLGPFDYLDECRKIANELGI